MEACLAEFPDEGTHIHGASKGGIASVVAYSTKALEGAFAKWRDFLTTICERLEDLLLDIVSQSPLARSAKLVEPLVFRCGCPPPIPKQSRSHVKI